MIVTGGKLVLSGIEPVKAVFSHVFKKFICHMFEPITKDSQSVINCMMHGLPRSLAGQKILRCHGN